jgi:hypothetical protein
MFMPPLCESHRFYANRIAVIVCVERHRRYRGERFDTAAQVGAVRHPTVSR